MPLNVLIVNEEEGFCSFLSSLLTGEGHVTRCCRGDREGLKLAAASLPQLIILEASRPGIGVIDIIQRLRRLPATRHVPMIVVSDCPELEYELLDVFDFLHRPLDINRLKEDLELLRQGRKKPRQPRQEVFHDTDFRDLSDFLVIHTGLHFERRNLKALERGVLSRMAALQIGTCAEYFEYLQMFQESRQELQKLLHFLTVGETFFFRYHAHFDAVQRILAAEYAPHPKKKLRIWSAGCSTGEEPYSLAISIMEALPDWRRRDIRIVATDINNRALKRAQEGVYGRWAMRVMEEAYLDRYFARVGQSYLLRGDVKQMVHFSHLNLQTGEYPLEGENDLFDIIFCRNVMIYFSHQTTKKIVERLAESLRPGGYLFLGHAETLAYTSTHFERQTHGGSFYYRKKEERAVPVRIVKPVQEIRPRQNVVPPAPLSPPRQPVELKPKISPAPEPPPPVDVNRLYAEAQVQFEAEHYGFAADLVQRLLELEPRHERALVLSGFIHANNGRFDDALAACGRALQLNDLLPEAYFLKGLILDMTEMSPAAADEYRKAILLKMDFVMPHYHLGRLYIRLGRLKEGVRELRNSLRILEKGGVESMVPYSGGLSREVFLGQLRTELDRVA